MTNDAVRADVGRSAATMRRGAAAAVTAVLLAPPFAGATPARVVYMCLGEEVTLLGTDGDDRIDGTDGRDVIAGLGGDDVIVGDDGGDRICGGDGSDDLQGRYGGDRIDGGEDRDGLDGGPGSDLLLGGPGRDSLVGGDGAGDTLVGGAGGDGLLGGDGDSDSDWLFGGVGNDHLNGGLAADDRLYGGTGKDFLAHGTVSYELSSAGVTVDFITPSTRTATGGEGNDTFWNVSGVTGSDHADVLTGGPERDVLRGRGGDDTIVAGGGSDEVDGGTGSDDLDGGDDEDLLTYADSPVGVSASLRDGTGEDTGPDVLAGFENVEGSFFDDTLTGDDAANWIHGSYGPDTVFGLAGDDHIHEAGAGDAGAGTDECISAFGVEGCETHHHVHSEPLPFVGDPVQSAALGRLGVVRGGTSPGLGRPGKRVEVWVRRTTSEGCWWWDAPSERFERGLCGTVHGNAVRVRKGEWSLSVDADLKPGAYRVGVSSVRYPHYECDGAYEPMCVDLRVVD